ncbi:MAG: hypothetical protein ACI80K_000711 [Paracoccaceae bacterium]|jgi:hypothetical protein
MSREELHASIALRPLLNRRPPFMSQSNDPKQDPSPTTSDESGEDHTRSLRLAYGDLSSGGSRYGDQKFRAEPYRSGHDEMEGYYEALSASIVPPSEQEGAIGLPVDALGIERPDQELVDAVTEVLALGDGMDATEIRVNCSKGIVTLNGQALDRTAKRAADDAAYGVLGVKDVMNRIGCT